MLASRLPAAMCLVLSLLFAPALAAAELNDGIDRSDPNFVKASLIVVGSGNDFFGCAGHSSLRLECPTFKLDNCFSCETESIRENFGRFLMGGLKMGMFAIPTQDFVKLYEKGGRRVTQYPLTLPPDVKQRLWKIMDEQVAAGRSLPYDYIKYCCVQTVLQPILEACRPYEVKFPAWSDRYKMTRRELLAENLAWCPWTRLVLHTIAGTEVDEKVSPPKTVILSPDLLELLRGTKVLGRSIVEGEGVVLQPHQAPTERGAFTPLVAALVLLGISIANFFLKTPWIDSALLVLQSVLGLLMAHLLCLSHLPATTWNWLVVPFNLLPLVFWKWRRLWAGWFAGVLLVWDLFVLCHPHQVTDSTYLVVVLAYVVLYCKISVKPFLEEKGLFK